MQPTSALVCARPPAWAAMMVVPMAPGPASSGTASGTTPESAPDSSSSASARDWRMPRREARAEELEQRLAEDRRAGEHREDRKGHHAGEALAPPFIAGPRSRSER